MIFLISFSIFTFSLQKVVSGDKHDIDLIVESPSTKIIYQEHRKDYDNIEFNTTVSEKLK